MTAYLALARKYRPQSFEDIVGQQHVSGTLQSAIDAGRIHHAYLFTGIRGIGKTTCARVLAKALNCQEGPTPNPCNECLSCKEITAGRSMDVMELDAASNRGIDDIRELREGVRYTTARDRFKVVIIDEVHMLTEAAFNALLKTLEEPPPHVRFVLATTDPQKIPATILSRCQRFDFRRVSAADLVSHLQRLCTAEKVEADEAALAVIVRQTQGSVRDSLSLLDQLIAASKGKLTVDWAKEVLGVADRRWVLESLSALLKGDAGKAIMVLREVFISGYDVNLFVTEVLTNLRHAMVLKIAGRNRELLDLSEGEIDELQVITRETNPYDLHYYLQVMLKAVENIRKSEFPLFAAEEALVRVASASQTVQIPALIQRLADLEQKIARTQALPPGLFPAAAKSPPQTAEAQSKRRNSEAPAGGEAGPAVPQSATAPAEQEEQPAQEIKLLPAEEYPIAHEKVAPSAAEAEQPAEPVEEPAPVEEPPPMEEPPPIEGTVPAQGPAPQRTDAPPPYPDLAEADLAEVWKGLVAFMRERSDGLLATVDSRLFEQCVIGGYDDGVVTVVIPSGAKAALKDYNLEALMQDYLRLPVEVRIRSSRKSLIDDSLAHDRKRRKQERREKLEQEMLDLPEARHVKDLFGAQFKVKVHEDALEEEE